MSGEQDDEIFGTCTHEQGCVVGAALAPILVLALFWLPEGQGQAVAASVVSIAVMPFVFSPLRRRTWFWVALLMIAAFHAAAVIAIDWHHAERSTFKLAMWLDVILVGGLIWLLSKIMPRQRT